MNFTASFLALLAAAQTIVALPFCTSESVEVFSPVPVTKLVCDGDSCKCTANLNYGDGKWVAQWTTAVFHKSIFGVADHMEAMRNIALAPVPVKKLVCDGDRYQCTATLDYGDGNWVAQWSTSVFHNSFTGEVAKQFSPVPVTKLVCDGDSYKCTANLDYGDGKWVAQWGTNVFHNSGAMPVPFLQQQTLPSN